MDDAQWRQLPPAEKEVEVRLLDDGVDRQERPVEEIREAQRVLTLQCWYSAVKNEDARAIAREMLEHQGIQVPEEAALDPATAESGRLLGQLQALDWALGEDRPVHW